MSFPTKRLRRLRISEKMRELVQETTLTPKDFICPVFVQEDLKTRIKVESMSEIERLPLEDVNEEVKTVQCKKESKKGCNGKATKCVTHNLWDELETHINTFFEKKSLEDLLKNNTEKRI